MKLRFPYAAWQLSLSATAREAHGPQQRPTAKINEYNFKIIIKSLFKKKNKTKNTVHARSVAQSCLTLFKLYGLQPAMLPRPWDSPVKNIGVGCPFLLQGIFPT